MLNCSIRIHVSKVYYCVHSYSFQTVCLSYCPTKECCGAVWGNKCTKYCIRPAVIYCCKEIDDPNCLAEKKACQLALEALEGATEASS